MGGKRMNRVVRNQGSYDVKRRAFLQTLQQSLWGG